jgi:protein gp37
LQKSKLGNGPVAGEAKGDTLKMEEGMNRTSIEWVQRPGTTGFTWNPIRARLKADVAQVVERRTRNAEAAGSSPAVGSKSGTFCTRISPGCQHCYASVINQRFGTGQEFIVPNLDKHEFYIDDRILAEPLKRKKPATIFVGDMFDLFHEAIPIAFVQAVFSVMAQAREHTFMVLTKRAKRMCETIRAWAREGLTLREGHGCKLPNAWLGVSVESPKYADERIPLLLQTPAAVRFLSIEPMLEEITFTRQHQFCPEHDFPGGFCTEWHEGIRQVDWVICGGESGPKARPFDLHWAESLLKQCRESEIPFFMKQLGAKPHYKLDCGESLLLPPQGSKGGDISKWPIELKVREWPRKRGIVRPPQAAQRR